MSDDEVSLAVAVIGFVSPLRKYEDAGLSYETNIIRDKLTLRQCTLPVYLNSSLDDDDSKDSSESTDVNRSLLYDKDDEKYTKYLMKLDPNDTKNQDHYKVLGLSKLRFQATMSDIKACYRQKVLKHHPDKMKHKGIPLPKGEEYFTCITRAYEQLGVSEAKRLAYDSVDNKFDDEIPQEKTITKDNIFTELGPVFSRNARWSTIKKVPELGNGKSSREEVEKFYSFWFDFKSWREFSYLDEEDKERGEDRYERREMEKINKAERERRRKDEMKRIRRLVEMAYAKDPRIVQFRKEDQAAKEQAKQERQRIVREKQEAIEKERQDKEDAERNEREAQLRAQREKKEREKKERDIVTKALNVQRKRFKKFAQDAGHWAVEPEDKLREMERVERLCLMLSVDEMSSMCDALEKVSLADDVRQVLDTAESDKKAATKKVPAAKVEDKGKENEKAALWTNEEIQLLVKASNTFPAGTVDRWIVIADYIEEHRKDKSTPPKNEKQVVKQCKAVQSMSVKLPSTTQNQLGTTLPDEDQWSAQEQKALEEAIRQFPASDAERWDKISTAVSTKSKKACIRRFKYLVQMVKNKK